MHRSRDNRYFLPGPTEVPDSVLAALATPVMPHRSKSFSEIYQRVSQKLQAVFCTNEPVYCLVSSGTGAMEAAVVNLLSPGDQAICVEAGKFGQRWGKICRQYGVIAHSLPVDWGESVSPDMIVEWLKKYPQSKAVFTTHCETSTGAKIDLEAIGKVVNQSSAVLVTDAISSLGTMPLFTKDWNIDVVISGSQKALMLPPGMGFITMSHKAWELVEQTSSPRFYFDLRSYQKNHEKLTTPYTPAINLFYGLEKALDRILEEGMNHLWARHQMLSKAACSALQALGLQLVARHPAAGMTAFYSPAGMDADELRKHLREEEMIHLAGGQDHLKGKICRLSHMGYTDHHQLTLVIAAIERSLKHLGYPIQLGQGVMEVLRVIWESANQTEPVVQGT